MRRAFLVLICLAAPGCRGNEGVPPPSREVRASPGAALATPADIDESRSENPVDGGILRRRLIGEPATLNAVLQTALPEQQVLQYVSRNLLDFDAQMQLVPGLAERWDLSPDGRTLRFHLRADAVWQDGSPVTSEDAVFTIRQIVDENVPAPIFKPFFERLESIEAIGPREFQARFREAYAYQAMAFVLPLLPSRRFAGKALLTAPENRAPFSNGPYRFVRWTSQQSIELARNDRYWGERGHFDRILFKILPENGTSWRALEDGDLDETWIDEGLKARSAGDPRFARCCRLVEFFNLDFNYISLNNRSPFFEDARVRRALTMLLDRESIVRSLYRGSARVISGPWAPASPAYDAAVEPLPYDPAAAARLLDEAGWRDTNGNGTRDRNGREFEFELLLSAGSVVGQQTDEILATSLGRVGIRARVRPLEWAAYVGRLDSGEYEAASGAWNVSEPNPDPFDFLHSSQVPPRGLNACFYSSPEADRLIEEARREPDEHRRLAIYHRLHRRLRDDAPAIWVVNATQKYALRRSLRGVQTSPLGLFGIWPGPLGWWKTEATGIGSR